MNYAVSLNKDDRETPTQNAPLWKLEQQAFDLLDAQFEEHSPIHAAALVSGGHDSITIAKLTAEWAKDRGKPFTCVHLDTGIGIQATQDYVIELCNANGWNLAIYKARENVNAKGQPDPQNYEDLVRSFGFPSPAMHNAVFHMVKERGIDRFMRETKTQRSDRVALVFGGRSLESERRKSMMSKFGHGMREGSRVFVNLIRDWSGSQCSDLMRRYDLPRNPVKDLIGISGECLCGGGSSNGLAEWEIISACFPDDPSVILINQLREEVKSLGFPWSWGEEVPDYWTKTQAHKEKFLAWLKTTNKKPRPGSTAHKLMCGSCNNKMTCPAAGGSDPGFVFSGSTATTPQQQPIQLQQLQTQQQLEDSAMNMSNWSNNTDLSQLMPLLNLLNAATTTTNTGPRLLVQRGKQAGREFYNATIPYTALKQYLRFEEQDLPDDLIAQRPYNPKKAEGCAKFMLENPDEYAFGSLVGVISPGDATFIPVLGDMGFLQFASPEAKALSDGQHRHGGIEMATTDGQFLDESTGVLFFIRETVPQKRNLFCNLNRYSTKPSTSINKLFDYSDPDSDRARKIMEGVTLFRVLIDVKNNTPKNKSVKLFSFNAFYEANADLFRGSSLPMSEQVRLGIAFWTKVADQIPHWSAVANLQAKPDEVRKHYIHHLQITLQAIARVGSRFIETDDWSPIAKLSKIDWSRNAEDWQGLIMVNGKLDAKEHGKAVLTSYLKQRLGVED